MDALFEEGKSDGGRIVRAAYDLVRQLSIDSERERFRAHLKRQSDPLTRLSADEIEQIIEPQIAEAALGVRLVSAMDTFLDRLHDPVEPLYKPIQLLATRFKDALFSELMRLEVAGVCEECGQTLVMTSRRKRFCSLNFESRDCGARARGRRSYKKHASPMMTRSESARTAARARWAKLRDSTREK